MVDGWAPRTRVMQTSPSSPMDQCDLVLTRSRGHVLVALVVDGAPGRSTARPRWPRETLFAAIGPAFLAHDAPELMLAEIDRRLRNAVLGRPWRLPAAAAALSWDETSGGMQLAEVGDTKAWLLADGRATPLTQGGIPAQGVRPTRLLGERSPEIRTHSRMLRADGNQPPTCVAILTDGAHLLLAPGGSPLPGHVGGWTLRAAGQDDATVLMIESPP